MSKELPMLFKAMGILQMLFNIPRAVLILARGGSMGMTEAMKDQKKSTSKEKAAFKNLQVNY